MVGACGELTGTAVSIWPFRSCTRVGVGVQRRPIDACRRKVACIACVVADSGVVGGHIGSVGGNGHGTREVDLLPARSGFRREGCTSQEGAAAAPEIADMRAGVGGALVETNAGNIARRVGIEPHAQLNRGVGANVRRGRCSGARPDRGWRLRCQPSRAGQKKNQCCHGPLDGSEIFRP